LFFPLVAISGGGGGKGGRWNHAIREGGGQLKTREKTSETEKIIRESQTAELRRCRVPFPVWEAPEKQGKRKK